MYGSLLSNETWLQPVCLEIIIIIIIIKNEKIRVNYVRTLQVHFTQSIISYYKGCIECETWYSFYQKQVNRVKVYH